MSYALRSCRCVVLLATLGCSRGCGGLSHAADSDPAETTDTSVETNEDAACDSTRRFDECTDVAGKVWRARLLVDDIALGWDSYDLDVIRSQEGLDTLWVSSGLATTGEPPVIVDFATEQVVVNSNRTFLRLEAFYEDARDPASLVAKISQTIPCDTGDSMAPPKLVVWATPIAAVTGCAQGTTCEDCF